MSYWSGLDAVGEGHQRGLRKLKGSAIRTTTMNPTTPEKEQFGMTIVPDGVLQSLILFACKQKNALEQYRTVSAKPSVRGASRERVASIRINFLQILQIQRILNLLVLYSLAFEATA